MQLISKIVKWAVASFCVVLIGVCAYVWGNHSLIENTASLPTKLSDFRLYEGRPADLRPGKDYTEYELATTLFTDHAHKQRLIKLPARTKLFPSGDGLPDFPDSTILVKTFYYYVDNRDTAKGRHLLETRILVKDKSKWNVGTYVWNEAQTEAVLQTRGTDEKVT
ncbi:hypothetical protein LZD49_35380 [Dyadobacter sp. CY261]|uniref:hypothetical protein n=1 Tax=Dyadobacter sp. CY261 TaxID=2907203 RepID=UPI001F4553E9|nr:hypothetical protein [Dyadobacter sp. CY261]MCF0075803.1 hypothetical protein [Dyadobacter sp. CY261]